MRTTPLIAALVATAFLAGCSSEQVPTRPQITTSPADPQGFGARGAYSSLITADGGVLTGDTGRFEVPAGALGFSTVLSMRTSVVDGENQCEMAPHGLKFLTGCTLSIQKPAFRTPGTVFHIFWWNEDAAEWVDVGGEDNGEWVSTTIHHFSFYKIAVKEEVR
jgi:hypothetical protein